MAVWRSVTLTCRQPSSGANSMNRLATRGVGRAVKERPAFLNFPAGLAITGAVPIMAQDECVGAIGVSGVQSQDDEKIASAGVAALGGLEQFPLNWMHAALLLPSSRGARGGSSDEPIRGLRLFAGAKVCSRPYPQPISAQNIGSTFTDTGCPPGTGCNRSLSYCPPPLRRLRGVSA